MPSVIFTVTSLLAMYTARLAAESPDTRFLVFLKVPVPCAGAVVAPKWVLTAAHCCYNSSEARDYQMLAGSPQHYQHRQGDELYIHPKGTADHPEAISKAHDFALLKVTPAWNIGQYVRVIHMFFGSFPRYPIMNNGCFAAGWNRKALNDDADTKAPIPSAHLLTTVVAEDCRKKLNRGVVENNICAQDQFGSWNGSDDLGEYSCAGDDGGPLVCDIFTEAGQLKRMLAGVMSSYEATGPLCRLALYAETGSLGAWLRERVPRIDREGLDEPLRSRILGVQGVGVVSSSAKRVVDEYSLRVVFSYSGVTMVIVHGAPARRIVALFLTMLCLMRIAALIVVFLNMFENERAWCRFGYIAAI